MVERLYFRKKFILIDNEGINTLYETNITSDGIEYFKFVPTNANGSYKIYLTQREQLEIEKKCILPLSIFLDKQGYDPDNFNKLFGRTKKIMKIIYESNIPHKDTSKIKKKILD